MSDDTNYVNVTGHSQMCGCLVCQKARHQSSLEKINHPAHYGGDTIYEAIKVIEAWDLGFNLGNTVKYIARNEHKGNRLEDLKKARWYLDREISNAEKAKTKPTEG